MGRKSIWKVIYIHMWYTFILYIQIHTLHTHTKGLRVYSQKRIIKIILLCNFVDIITKSILTWYARIYLHLYQYINIMITFDILNFLHKQFTPPRKVKYWVYKTGAVNHCSQTRATIAQGTPCSSKKKQKKLHLEPQGISCDTSSFVLQQGQQCVRFSSAIFI